MTSDLREKLKEIIKDCDHMHSEKCGNNYYGVKGFSCRCGRGRCMDDDVDAILKLFESELAQAVKRIEDIIENHRDCEPGGCAAMILAELAQQEVNKE